MVEEINRAKEVAEGIKERVRLISLSVKEDSEVLKSE